jgi:DNA-binding Lrp family transcriptional regulator
MRSMLLNALVDNLAITYNELSYLLIMPRRTVSREMKKLKDASAIKREDTRKNGRLIVKPEDAEDS